MKYFLTPKFPLKKGPRPSLPLKLTEDASEVVSVNFYLLQGGVVEAIMKKSVIFFGGWNIFYGFLTLKLPLKRGPRQSLSLKLREDAPEVVFINFYPLQGGVVEDIIRKSVIFFGGWNIFYGFLTLKLPLKRGPRHPLSWKLTEDAFEVGFCQRYHEEIEFSDLLGSSMENPLTAWVSATPERPKFFLDPLEILFIQIQ